MEFKPTKRKMLVSIVIPLSIIILFLSSTPMCYEKMGRRSEVDLSFSYWKECSIFEFVSQNLGFMIIFWTILFLLVYVFYSLSQKKSKKKKG